MVSTSSPDDPLAAARDAGLRYVTDRSPGIRRRRSGQGLGYLDAQGRPIRDAETLARIQALAIPPAWTEVWICPWANGHIQATGRDARGRKQYRYHARWRRHRDESKYGTMLESLRQRAAAEMTDVRGLSPEESAVLALLQRRLAQEESHDRPGRPAAPKKAATRHRSPGLQSARP
jgi:DNA topoisomerase-1